MRVDGALMKSLLSAESNILIAVFVNCVCQVKLLELERERWTGMDKTG